jgi:hypothetical protein
MIVSVAISILYSDREFDGLQSKSAPLTDDDDDAWLGEGNDDLHLRALIESRNAIIRI